MMRMPPEPSTWNLSSRLRGALRLTVIGAQWSQHRLCKMGFAASSQCLVCGARGDLHRRFWSCPQSDDMRRLVVDQECRDMANRAEVNDMFFTRALRPRAMLPDIPPPLDAQRWWCCVGGQGVDVAGVVYTGGSAQSP
eukprot:7548453-Pyramimonas_sp.AAC.1